MFNVPSQFAGSLPFGMFSSQEVPFGLATLQADPNCVLIQDPSQVWGVQDFLPMRNLLTYSEDFSNSAWTKRGACSLTSGQSDPWGTSRATKIDGIGTGGVDDIYYKVGTTTTSGVLAGFWFNKISTSGTLRVTNGNGGSNGTWLVDLSAVQSGWVFVTKNTAGVTVSIPFTYALNGGYGPLFSCTAGAPISFYLSGVMVCSADTIDKSYQKITDWTTEQYAWAAQKSVPWLRRNRFLNTTTLGTQTVSSVTASPITVSFKGTGTITFSTAYSGSLVGTGANDRVTTTFTPSAGNLVCTVTGTVTEAQCENGSVATEYQPILASWDATYTANAIAAGYPISIWQDAAGTTAVNGDNQPIGKMLDMKGDYTAIQATTANQPKWRLDANGKPYIERDGVNDALPITLPNLGSNCSVYIGEGSTVTELTAQTLNGSYAPITPAKDYGRVIFQTPTSKSAKVIKWLLAKAGY